MSVGLASSLPATPRRWAEVSMSVRRARSEAEIPTASMADIAFLLIVFFMLTSVFAETRGLEFSVPPPGPPPADVDRAVHVAIDEAGNVTLDGAAIASDAVDAQLAAHLLPKLQGWPDKPILVTADKAAPYGAFVGVYDALRQTERKAHEAGFMPPRESLKISLPSLAELEALKARFGEHHFR